MTEEDKEVGVEENKDTVSFEQDEEMGDCIDLSGYDEDAGFEAIPRGIYNVVVDEAEYKLSSKGNKMISLKLQIEEGDYAKRILFTHVVFSEKTMGRAKKMIRALGLIDLLSRKFDPSAEADSFVGARARAKVVIKPYEGEMKNEVKELMPATGGSENAFAGM